MKHTLITKLNSLPRRTKLIAIGLGIIILFGIIRTVTTQNENGLERFAVSRGTIRQTVIVSGNAQSGGNAAVYSPVTGIVGTILVSNGQIVPSDAPLFTVRSTASAAEQASLYSTYQQAKAAVATAEENTFAFQSQLEAARKSVIDASSAVTTMTNRRNESKANPQTGEKYTENEVESILSTLTAARQLFSSYEKRFTDADTFVAAAKAQEHAAWLAYSVATTNATVYAPSAGTVANIAVNPGDNVTSQSLNRTSSADPVLRITTPAGMSVSMKLNEIDIPHIRLNQEAEIVFDALPGQIFHGTVTKIDDVGTNIQGVVTYGAYVTLSDATGDIKTGMTAMITIHTKSKDNVILVPNTALRNSNGETTVTIVRTRNKPETVAVTTGIKSETQTEIETGLTDNDILLIATQ